MLSTYIAANNDEQNLKYARLNPYMLRTPSVATIILAVKYLSSSRKAYCLIK
jgi:hypothetical protein